MQRDRGSPSAFPGARWMHGSRRSWSLFCRAATSLSCPFETALCYGSHSACSHIDPRESCVSVFARTRFVFSSGVDAPVCPHGLRLGSVCGRLTLALR